LPHLTGTVYIHHRIIATISIHIVADQITVCVDITISVEESTGYGVIVSALQVVERGFGIVVVSTVAERVIRGICIITCGVQNVGRMVSPSIVRVGNHLGARFIVNRNDIAKQIFLKEEVDEYTFYHRRRAILHADRATCFVVQVNKRIVTPSFADDLRAVECVDVLNGAYFFTCSDAGVIVLVDIGRAVFSCCCQLAAVFPGKGITCSIGMICRWVADCVISDCRTAGSVIAQPKHIIPACRGIVC